MLKAYVNFTSVSDEDFKYGFEWNDASTLVLPSVGDYTTMSNVHAKRVIKREYYYACSQNQGYVAIELILE